MRTTSPALLASLAACMPSLAASSVVVAPSMASSLLVRPMQTPRSFVKMQYGAPQQGYAQQGYGAPQQGYGAPQQGYGGMPSPPAVANANAWYIFPRDGASGMIVNNYQVFNGQSQVLGRGDLMANPNQQLRPDQQGISFEQCAVQIAPDGTHAILHAMGQTPTGWRTRPDEAWNWLQPGQSTIMQHHWKITMDYNYPEQAVFKLADGKLANEAGPCWQYVSQYQNGGQGGQQQGGMGGQQQGYGGQPQQGYGQPQQGYYQ